MIFHIPPSFDFFDLSSQFRKLTLYEAQARLVCTVRALGVGREVRTLMGMLCRALAHADRFGGEVQATLQSVVPDIRRDAGADGAVMGSISPIGTFR